MGLGQPPGGGRDLNDHDSYGQPGRPRSPGGGKRAKAAAVAAVTTVVVAACVTGVLLLRGGEVDAAGGGSTTAPVSASDDATATAPASGGPPAGALGRPTVPGWKVVVNPKWGTIFDVPPDWDVRSPDLLLGFDDDAVDQSDPDNWGKLIIVMGAPAVLRDDWCLSDSDKDGRVDGALLAAAGTKGAEGARSTGDIALSQSERWVYGGYTQPDTKSVVTDPRARPYTTRSGVKGSIAWARSRNAPRDDRCATDGKALTFGFRNLSGGFVAWSLFSATGVRDEVPDATAMRILSTVRLLGQPGPSRSEAPTPLR
ncbi:hypothetical protein ABZ920_10335 [Streptomyces sp. NPDC046831]|uniref:hypothetical protein n=1 Tax=Streptomyces sp. NPDC046831 TaxID=3154805 RepID=UPI0033D1F20E